MEGAVLGGEQVGHVHDGHCGGLVVRGGYLVHTI